MGGALANGALGNRRGLMIGGCRLLICDVWACGSLGGWSAQRMLLLEHRKKAGGSLAYEESLAS